MKKYLLSFAVLLMGTFVLTSCDDDDTPDVLTPVAVNKGVYVINSGNQGSAIDGSLTYIEADTWNTTLDAFKNANGKSIGLTANDGIVYGNKLYVAVTDENTIWVLDNNNLGIIKQLKTVDMMGANKGNKPRHLTALGGYIFVSTYDGYVAAIDTTAYGVVATYKVGSYPEGMAIAGNYLYVVNSDYADGVNPSISAIDLNVAITNVDSNGDVQNAVTELKDPLITNPVAIAANAYGLFVLDSGTYESDENYNYTQVGAGIRKIMNGTVSVVADATAMAMTGTKIYLINAPYSTSGITPTYKIYDTATGSLSDFIPNGDHSTNKNAPFSPAAIAVDPVRSYVYIASYSPDPDFPAFAGYSINGYLNVYDMSGNLIKTCDTGVGPTAIVPNTFVVYE